MPIDLTAIQLSADTLKALEAQIAKYKRYSNFPGTVQQLSQITDNAGIIQAGEIRLGNGVLPGAGYDGLRLAYPASTLVYLSQEWNFVALAADVLQVGIRASDGKLIAGAGEVALDSTGVRLISSGIAKLAWYDSLTTPLGNRSADISYDSTFDRLSINAWEVSSTVILNITDETGSYSPTIAFYENATDNHQYLEWDTKNFGSMIFNMIDAVQIVGKEDAAHTDLTETFFNGLGLDLDFRIESDANTHMFFLDGGTNRIGFGLSSPQELFDANGNVRFRGYADLIEGTAPGTPSTGYGRFYVKSSDSLPYFKDDGGTEHALTGGGGASSIIQRSTTDNVINTTAAETNLFSFSLPANTLTTDGILKIRARITNYNNLGAGAGTWTFKSYFGATALTYTISVPNNSTVPTHIEFDIIGSGATNSQDLYSFVNPGGTGNAAVGTSAIDTTSAVTVKISVTLPASAASIGCTLWNYEAILFD